MWSKVAGVALLLMAIVAMFAEFFVRQSLSVAGDASTTANNIMASEGLFRISIASYLIILFLDVVVALALYIVLNPVNKPLALLAAVFRLIYTTIRGVSEVLYFIVLILLSGADYLTVFTPVQLHALVSVLLNADSIPIGWIFFGIHLFFLGYLVFKSGYFPRILGVLLIIASFAYLLENSAIILLSNYADYEAIITLIIFLPAFIGEMALSLWLLLKVKATTIPDMNS
jgi:hypothetical protein